MRKKIALASSILLLSTLANAEIDQSGFFIGFDLSQMDSKVVYDNSGGSFTSAKYINNLDDKSLSFKAGYQAYFTRVYVRYNQFEYKDEYRDKFLIDGKVYEVNAEYIPVLYMTEGKNWNIRGIFGLGLGYNSSKADISDGSLLPDGMESGNTQNYMEYGYQLGMLSETSFGLSFETGYRVRYGNIQEFNDGASTVSFSLKSQELYLGFNYLF